MKRVILVLSIAGCATIGSDSDLAEVPSSGVGPFRKFEAKEVKGIAPFVLDSSRTEYVEPSVLAGDGTGVILYATKRTSDTTSEIVRTRADDARTFYGATGHFGKAPITVLAPALPWEGTALGRPSALRVRGEVWLYYATANGIGLARSGDGIHFRREANPVLGPANPGGWETEAPKEPSVAVFPDGTFHMLYVSGSSIGEAASGDGVHFQRVDAVPTVAGPEPILGPNPRKGATDHGAVGCPTIVPRMTPADRLHVRVLYTAYDKPRTDPTATTVLAFAGRYETTGPLVVNELPVLALKAGERCPSLLEPAGAPHRLLYFDLRQPGQTLHGIAAAIAPVTSKLGDLGDFPPSP
ncbi:MAG: hypothetical protein U0174_04495 [Polyangiaceae bacterium]